MKAFFYFFYPLVFWSACFLLGSKTAAAQTAETTADNTEQTESTRLKVKGQISYYAVQHNGLRPLKMSDQPVAAWFAVDVENFKSDQLLFKSLIEYEGCRFEIRHISPTHLEFEIWGNPEKIRALFTLFEKINLKVTLLEFIEKP